MKYFKYISVIIALFLFNTLRVSAQIPTDIDPGQNENPVNLYEQPEFIIPILGLFVLLVGFYVWRKKKNKQ